MGGGGEVKALLVFRALAYAVGKTKCAFTCGWFFFCRLVYNEFEYGKLRVLKRNFPLFIYKFKCTKIFLLITIKQFVICVVVHWPFFIIGVVICQACWMCKLFGKLLAELGSCEFANVLTLGKLNFVQIYLMILKVEDCLLMQSLQLHKTHSSSRQFLRMLCLLVLLHLDFLLFLANTRLSLILN